MGRKAHGGKEAPRARKTASHSPRAAAARPQKTHPQRRRGELDFTQDSSDDEPHAAREEGGPGAGR